MSGLTRRTRQIRALFGAEGTLFLRALGYCIAMRIAMWTVPAAVLLRFVDRRVGAARATGVPGRDVAEIAWAIRAAARRVPRSTCLVEGVSGQLLLARYGHPSRLCIGVRREPDRSFRAHAWVEVSGRIVVGAQPGEWYYPLPDFGDVLRQGLLR